MSIIRAEVSGYRHIGYYDSEFVIKGILHIDTRQYNFLHYDGAFGFSRLEIKAGKVKASYDEAEGFQMQQGKEAPEGGLLNVNRKDAIKQIQEAATSYLTTDLNAWAEYFNLATRSAGPFAYTLTQCIAFPTEKYRCTITPASPYCELIYNLASMKNVRKSNHRCSQAKNCSTQRLTLTLSKDQPDGSIVSCFWMTKSTSFHSIRTIPVSSA